MTNPSGTVGRRVSMYSTVTSCVPVGLGEAAGSPMAPKPNRLSVQRAMEPNTSRPAA